MNATEAGKAPRHLLWAAIAIFFVLHLYQLSAPPNGYHQWRESDTAAVILNYYQEDLSFLHPRINQRGATSGITGMELPVYNYSAALLYFVAGPSHGVARLLTVLAACIGLWLFYRIVTVLSNAKAASFACWALAFSPLFLFYSHKIMPDIWMLTLLLGAVYSYVLYAKNDSIRFWLASAILLVLSACLKPLGLSVCLLFLYLSRSQKRRRQTAVIPWAVYVAITFLAVTGWFLYARWVNETHGSPGFYLGEMLWDFSDYLFSPQFYKKLFMQWPFELWIGWVLVPAFIYGVYHTIKGGSGAAYYIWILCCYLAFAMISGHSSSHDYYTLIIVPPLAALSGLGLYGMHKTGHWRRYLVVVLLVVAPAGAIARIHHRLTTVEEFDQMRKDAQRAIPAESLVMVQDTTPAIRLYQLNRKGWPLRGEIEYRTIKEYVEQGGKYLILDEPIDNYDDSLSILFKETDQGIGRLYLYVVKN